MALLLCVPVVLATRDDPPKKEDAWRPVRFLVGTWDDVAEGEAGRGIVKRTYEFVMNGPFLHERNVSTYPPQDKNPKGEVHEHCTMFSYERPGELILPIDLLKTGLTYLAWLWSGDISKYGCSRRSPLSACH